MRLLTLTLVALLGLGTVAMACDGKMRNQTTASQQDETLWPRDRQG